MNAQCVCMRTSIKFKTDSSMVINLKLLKVWDPNVDWSKNANHMLNEKQLDKDMPNKSLQVVWKLPKLKTCDAYTCLSKIKQFNYMFQGM